MERTEEQREPAALGPKVAPWDAVACGERGVGSKVRAVACGVKDARDGPMAITRETRQKSISSSRQGCISMGISPVNMPIAKT